MPAGTTPFQYAVVRSASHTKPHPYGDEDIAASKPSSNGRSLPIRSGSRLLQTSLRTVLAMPDATHSLVPTLPALQRARRLYWLLTALVVMLAASCLHLGDQLRETRLEGTRSNLVAQVRFALASPRPNQETRILQLLDSARRLRSDVDLRSEATTVLAFRFHDRTGRRTNEPTVCANPIFPSAWSASADNIALSRDGRIIRLFANNDCLEIPVDRPTSRPFRIAGIPLNPPRLSMTNASGHLIAAITNDTVALLAFDRSGNPVEFVRLSPQRRRRPVALIWHPDGNRLAIACAINGIPSSMPESSGPLEIWDIERLRTSLEGLQLGWDSADPTLPLLTPTDWTWRYTVAAGAILIACIAGGAILIHRSILRQYEEAVAAAQARSAELERARETLAHAEKLRALGTLAAGIAHDFNNLLSIISMARQLVERALRPSGVPREHLLHIGQAVEQGRSLVRSILGYSRDTMTLSRFTRIPEVTDEVVTLLHRQFLSGLTVKVEHTGECPRVAVNRGRLEQVLLNLLVNAAEAMGGRGTLTLITRGATDPGECLLPPAEDSAWAEISISDTGPGIPPELLPRIFEPFFTTKTIGQERGTGLGLATVWRIAEEEGFGIRLETSVGLGSTFHIFIPVERPRPADGPASPVRGPDA